MDESSFSFTGKDWISGFLVSEEASRLSDLITEGIRNWLQSRHANHGLRLPPESEFIECRRKLADLPLAQLDPLSKPPHGQPSLRAYLDTPRHEDPWNALEVGETPYLLTQGPNCAAAPTDPSVPSHLVSTPHIAEIDHNDRNAPDSEIHHVHTKLQELYNVNPVSSTNINLQVYAPYIQTWAPEMLDDRFSGILMGDGSTIAGQTLTKFAQGNVSVATSSQSILSDATEVEPVIHQHSPQHSMASDVSSIPDSRCAADTTNDYRCPRCNRVCRYKWKYQDHMLSHSSQKRFQCNICPADFKHERDLLKHQKTSAKHKRALTLSRHASASALASIPENTNPRRPVAPSSLSPRTRIPRPAEHNSMTHNTDRITRVRDAVSRSELASSEFPRRMAVDTSSNLSVEQNPFVDPQLTYDGSTPQSSGSSSIPQGIVLSQTPPISVSEWHLESQASSSYSGRPQGFYTRKSIRTGSKSDQG